MGAVRGIVGALAVALMSCGRAETPYVQPLTVTDGAGREVHVPERPLRIVSASLASDEILLDLVTPERIAALHQVVDNPQISNAVEKAKLVAGRVTSQNPEGIIALEPDVVFVASYSEAAFVDLLEVAGLPVVRLGPCSTIAEIEANIDLVSRVVGEEQAAGRLVQDMADRLANIRRRIFFDLDKAPESAARPNVLYYSFAGDTAGPGSPIHEIITLAGGHNVAEDVGIENEANLSIETIVKLDPDVILTTTWQPTGEKDARGVGLHHPAFQELRAVREGKVHALEGKVLTSVSHHIVTAVEELARILHPQEFQDEIPPWAG